MVTWSPVTIVEQRIIQYSVITYNGKSNPQIHVAPSTTTSIRIDGLSSGTYIVFVVATSGSDYGLSLKAFRMEGGMYMCVVYHR